MALFKKDKMTEDRWEGEDAICEKEMASHEADRAKLVARLAKTRYTPEYLADLRATCEAISCGYEHFTLLEKRHTYELLDLTARLAIEEGCKVVHAECVLDAKRLKVGKVGAIASTLSRPTAAIRSIRTCTRRSRV